MGIKSSLHVWQNISWTFFPSGLPGGSDSKNLPADAGDLGLIPGLGRSPGKGNGYPLQDSGLENSMDRRAWQAAVHGVTKSWTRLNDFHNSSHRTPAPTLKHPPPPSSWPTSSSPKPAASEQVAGIFLHRSSPGNPPIPATLCFGISAKCKGPGCLPCLGKRWINLLCLFSWNWSWFISSYLSSGEGVILIG